MTAARWVLMAALAALTLGLLPACRPPIRRAINTPGGPPPGDPEVGPGSVGCASAGCHGGTIPPDADRRAADAWRWAATVWRTQDPHSRAYHTLLGRESQAILQRLGDGSRPAHRDWRCLSCHSDPRLAHLDASPSVVDARSDGVGCESCHGNADRWLSAHLTWPPRAGRRRLYERHGMAWLNSLNDRAAVCAGCHVGAPAGEGACVPRDVNHDLIAAGHPRLNFEFATYLRAMPAHWQEKDREGWAPLPPHFATRAWSAGQVATLRASLSLLADRLPKPGQPGTDRPWPELSELNCFDCHHDLNAAGRSTPPAGGKRGLAGWHRGPELRRLAGGGAAAAALLEELSRLWPSADCLRAIAPGLRDALKQPPTSPEELLKWVRTGDEGPGRLSWDEAGWLYHALVAVELARRERSREAEDEMDRRFADLAGRLRLDRDNGRGEARYHSPRRYDPAGVHIPFLELMNRLVQLQRPGPRPE